MVRSQPSPAPRAVHGLVRTGVLTLVLVALGGCSLVARPTPPGPAPGIPGAAPRAPAPVPGLVEEGVASWYGPGFHGRQTASGEVYDMEAPTAAHRTLPFGTLVRVHNLESGESTELRINDRGPFVRGRIIDVSRSGARELGLLGPGIARVRVEVLGAPTAGPTCWEVQAGAFRERENAEDLRRRLGEAGFTARTQEGPDGVLRVRVGPFDSPEEAQQAEGRVDGFLLRC
jgi:rare lipoprotein A